MRPTAPAERARRQAGYTLPQAARIARLHPRRLRHYELHGGATDATARRLCYFYEAGADVFHALLFGPSYQTNSHFSNSSGGVTTSIPSTPETAGQSTRVRCTVLNSVPRRTISRDEPE